MQYFAAGVPAVASPVGVNAEFVADGRGLAATTDADWQLALTELLMRRSSSRLRRECRDAIFVEQHYSYQRWAPELAALVQRSAADASRVTARLPPVVAQENLECQQGPQRVTVVGMSGAVLGQHRIKRLPAARGRASRAPAPSIESV